jgi:Tol biopolymer transport system component
VYRRITPNEAAVILRDVLRAEDHILESVGRPGHSIDGVSVSPDGTKFTYIVHDGASGTSTLYLRSLAGGEARELSRTDAPNLLLNVAEWTPDGKRLIVAKGVSDSQGFILAKGSLWILPIDGGREIEIPGLHAKMQANTIRVHPDGKRVTFSTGGVRFEVWTLTNFLTAGGPGK